jgi:energy-converting hydrogenase Eha subunit F
MFNKIKSDLKKFFLVVIAILLVLGFFVYKMLNPKEKIEEQKEQVKIQEDTSPKQNKLDDNFYSNIMLEGKGNEKSERYVAILSDYSCP